MAMPQLAVRKKFVKKRSNHKQKNAAYVKQARRGMMGFTIVWWDDDPFHESSVIRDSRVTHVNPTQKLICIDMWNAAQNWILTTEFTWTVYVDAHFELNNKASADLKKEEGEFRITGPLRKPGFNDLNDAIEAWLKEVRFLNDQLPDGHKNKGRFTGCNFQSTVTGV